MKINFLDIQYNKILDFLLKYILKLIFKRFYL
jgi:hypothetical protein